MLRILLRTILPLAVLFAGCQPSGKQETASVADSTENQYVRVPGKNALRLLTDRPPNLETPLHFFKYDLTPNEAFFIRWHMSGLPAEVDTQTFRLQIDGFVNHPLSLTLNDLRTKFPQRKMVAVCACAGNARSLFKPRVAGAQWVNGGMGNAEWTGVSLKDLLQAAGVKSGAVTISFNGLDSPPLSATPDFVKSLTYEHANDGEVMIAYAMNGRPLPLLNGFPLKLVVPGWYATYWVGMLSEIKVHPDTFHGYWMDKAYLIPKDDKTGNENPDKLAKDMEPVNRIALRSIFVSPVPGTVFEAGKTQTIEGLAFDDGAGISSVELSNDSCKTWQPAQLQPSLGKYSWRRWTFDFRPSKEGKQVLWVRAHNAEGKTQPAHQWNRSGYMRNEIESLELTVRHAQ